LDASFFHFLTIVRDVHFFFSDTALFVLLVFQYQDHHAFGFALKMIVVSQKFNDRLWLKTDLKPVDFHPN